MSKEWQEMTNEYLKVRRLLVLVLDGYLGRFSDVTRGLGRVLTM